MRMLLPGCVLLAMFELWTFIILVQKSGASILNEDAIECFLARASIDDIDRATAAAQSFTLLFFVAGIIAALP